MFMPVRQIFDFQCDGIIDRLVQYSGKSFSLKDVIKLLKKELPKEGNV